MGKSGDEGMRILGLDEGGTSFGLMIIICINKLKARSRAEIGPKSLKISAMSSGNRSSIEGCISLMLIVSNNPLLHSPEASLRLKICRPSPSLPPANCFSKIKDWRPNRWPWSTPRKPIWSGRIQETVQANFSSWIRPKSNQGSERCRTSRNVMPTCFGHFLVDWGKNEISQRCTTNARKVTKYGDWGRIS